ncbi:TVP38/TMEM64 family protein [Bacillus changyiensis]|uniref:TVP38/TMEM64 family protein n=1 Tax=Bacillus changyiensis TaxID=3004103 RepID=UPI0022E94F5B|nr:TVP38/TMEM64 family protein [Bacillus changyiensis]MDA1477569.1 TVP38/TMEM64 family protein [Bacillus changyiensis]
MSIKTLGKWMAVVVVVAVGIWFNTKFVNINPKQIREWVMSFGIFAPMMYIGLLIIRPFLLLPASVFAVSGGLAFGPLLGSLYCFVGAAGGAFLSFALAYKIGANFNRISVKLKTLRMILHKNSFFYILYLRLAPIHFDTVSYAAGIFKVKPLPFLAATSIGIIPGTIILNILGSSLLSGDMMAIIITLLIYLLFITIPLLLRKKMMELFQ